MNRLDTLPCSLAASTERVSLAPQEYEQNQLEALFTPQHYERGYAYPLLVWLHGQGNSERQLASVLPQISQRNFVGASVRGTVPWYASSFAGARPLAAVDGYHWQQSPQQVEDACERVDCLIQQAVRVFNVHADRIFIAGQGSGGTMALRLAMMRPHLFAGAISIGGRLPAGQQPMCNLDRVRKLPVFLAAGAASKGYQAEQVCEDLRLLHSAGVAVTLRQYPSGDDVHPQCLHDVNEWLMECLATACGASIVR